MRVKTSRNATPVKSAYSGKRSPFSRSITPTKHSTHFGVSNTSGMAMAIEQPRRAPISKRIRRDHAQTKQDPDRILTI